MKKLSLKQTTECFKGQKVNEITSPPFLYLPCDRFRETLGEFLQLAKKHINAICSRYEFLFLFVSSCFRYVKRKHCCDFSITPFSPWMISFSSHKVCRKFRGYFNGTLGKSEYKALLLFATTYEASQINKKHSPNWLDNVTRIASA